jgi:hypothetical protein
VRGSAYRDFVLVAVDGVVDGLHHLEQRAIFQCAALVAVARLGLWDERGRRGRHAGAVELGRAGEDSESSRPQPVPDLLYLSVNIAKIIHDASSAREDQRRQAVNNIM